MVDDRELLSRWRGGDRSAGNDLFDRHFDSLRRFFGSKLPVTDVEDVLQRTMVSCLESVEKFRGDSSFRTYLFVIARRELYDYIARRNRTASRDAPDLGVTSIQDVGLTPSLFAAAREQHHQIIDAMQRIPVDFQVTLELYYWEQLRGPELAEVFGIAATTVRTRLHRAREALRKELQRFAPGVDRGDEALGRSIVELGAQA